MSIKTDAVVIRDETTTGANTAVRVGTNLVAIADDLVAKQASIDLKQNKPSEGAFVDGDKTKLDGITAGATPDQVLPTSGVDFDPVGTDNSDDNAVNSLYSGLATSKQDALDVVGQAEAEAGTATTERIWTAERVKQAIDALGGSVDDTAYDVSWNGVTTKAPSQNALYDFIESQVFKVDINSNISPIYWGGTQAEYDIDFPSGHPANYFVVITDGVVPPTNASDIVNTPSGNLVATDVQGALNELQAEVDDNTAKVGVTAQMVSDINTNNLKVGITSQQAQDITDNATDVSDAGLAIGLLQTSQAQQDVKLDLIEDGATNDTTSTIQTKRPLKTINGESLEGSGDVVISGGSAAPFIYWEGSSSTSNFRYYFIKTPDWNQASTFYQGTSTNIPIYNFSGSVGLGVTENKTITSIKANWLGQSSYNVNIYICVKRFTQIASDLNITASGTTLTSTTYTFVAGDVGKVIWVNGANTSGASLQTTIASFTDANTVELTDAAVTTVTNESAAIEENIELYVSPSLPIVAYHPYEIDITGISFDLEAGDRVYISNKGDSGSISPLNYKIELY